MEVSKASERVNSLHEGIDTLLEKLVRVQTALTEIELRFSQLPTADDLQELWHAMPSADGLREFDELWNSGKLPTIDELREYADAASDISAK
jgi:hypothetical protein